MTDARRSPSLSIIVPVFNERGTLLPVLRVLRDVDFGVPAEVLVVDDGSTDGTRDLYPTVQAEMPEVRVLLHPQNRGKGAAVRTGIAAATGSIIAVQDADLEYDPAEIRTLLGPILRGECHVVFGSRFLRRNPVLYRSYYLGNRVLSAVISVLYGARVTDAYTCYKVFAREVLTDIRLDSRGFEIEAELTCKLLRRHRRIAEMPISYRPRTLTQGKKIRFRDAVRGMMTIVWLRCVPSQCL